MLLVTEYDKALNIEEKLPPSMVRKLYLSEGVTPRINTTPSLFGKPVHIIHLGYNLRAAESFVKSLEGDTSDVILVAPISRWGLYSIKLKDVKDIQISNQFDTRESKILLTQELTGLSARQSGIAMNLLKYNLALLEKNLDLLRWCRATGSDIETALSSVEHYSYTDILFYLCGSKNHTKEKFLRTLSKYRHGKKHILKYLKSTLDHFIAFKLDGEEPPKDVKYTITKLSLFLYLEDAMRLRYSLDKVTDLADLLKGEIYK